MRNPKHMTYKEIEKAIPQFVPFVHGWSNEANAFSMQASMMDGVYTIWSYRTVIAVHHEDAGWWLNDNKYSVTTSKQQNMIKRVLFG